LVDGVNGESLWQNFAWRERKIIRNDESAGLKPTFGEDAAPAPSPKKDYDRSFNDKDRSKNDNDPFKTCNDPFKTCNDPFKNDYEPLKTCNHPLKTCNDLKMVMTRKGRLTTPVMKVTKEPS
jgi:hypothetical protein